MSSFTILKTKNSLSLSLPLSLPRSTTCLLCPLRGLIPAINNSLPKYNLFTYCLYPYLGPTLPLADQICCSSSVKGYCSLLFPFSLVSFYFLLFSPRSLPPACKHAIHFHVLISLLILHPCPTPAPFAVYRKTPVCQLVFNKTGGKNINSLFKKPTPPLFRL